MSAVPKRDSDHPPRQRRPRHGLAQRRDASTRPSSICSRRCDPGQHTPSRRRVAPQAKDEQWRRRAARSRRARARAHGATGRRAASPARRSRATSARSAAGNSIGSISHAAVSISSRRRSPMPRLDRSLAAVGADAEQLPDLGEAEAPDVMQQQRFAAVGQQASSARADDRDRPTPRLRRAPADPAVPDPAAGRRPRGADPSARRAWRW